MGIGADHKQNPEPKTLSAPANEVEGLPVRLNKRWGTTTAYSGGNEAFANWEKEEEQIEQRVGTAEIEIASRQFFVAAGGQEWNDSLSTINDLEYFIDGRASNVENGLGYVVAKKRQNKEGLFGWKVS